MTEGAAMAGRRMDRRAAVAACVLGIALLPLGGCTLTPLGAASLGADVISLNASKKTIGDHIVSAATGRDCSTIAYTETGDYCPDKLMVDRSRVYCYRTLADVECHHIPDPYKNGHTALASPPPDIKTVPRKKGWFDE